MGTTKEPVAKRSKWRTEIPDLSGLKKEDFTAKYEFKRNIAMANAYFSGKRMAKDLGIQYGIGLYRVRQISYDLKDRVNKLGKYAPVPVKTNTKKVKKKNSVKANNKK